MYTDEMSADFHKIKPPADFKVDLYDNEQFITIMIDPNTLKDIDQARGEEIVKYITDVKTMLESHGAGVMIVREELSEG